MRTQNDRADEKQHVPAMQNQGTAGASDHIAAAGGMQNDFKFEAAHIA